MSVVIRPDVSSDEKWRLMHLIYLEKRFLSWDSNTLPFDYRGDAVSVFGATALTKTPFTMQHFGHGTAN